MGGKQIYKERDKYSMQLVRIVRLVGLMLPFLIIGYGLAAWAGWLEKSPLFNEQIFIGLSVAFVVAGVSEYLMPRSLYDKLTPLYMFVYTLLGAGYVIWVSGADSPIIFCWIVLMIVNDLYFGRFWFWITSFALVATALVAYILQPGEPISTLLTYASLAVFALVIGFVVSSLRRIQSVEHSDLQRTREDQMQQRQALLTILNGTSQAIFTVSDGGTVRIYNAAFLNLLDTNKSLSGQDVDEVLPLHALNGDPISFKSLLDGTTHFERDDFLLRFSEGDEMRLHISVNKVQGSFSSGQQTTSGGFICIVRDVTKEKSLEEERDEFISVVSHELRTPVAITEGTISNVQFFLKQGADPHKLEPALKEAHDQVMLLSSMINDLGTLSRAERGIGDSLEEINVQELAEGLYKKYVDSAQKKGLTLDLDTSGRLGTVVTSRLYLEEMLQNFITNAIKYTQEGTVTVIVKKVPGGIEFAVKDSGIGISKSDLKHIFEKFYRSEDYRTRETSGTGLGLYVTTKLMKKLGTKIMVDSRLNHGSTFSFVLADQNAEQALDSREETVHT